MDDSIRSLNSQERDAISYYVNDYTYCESAKRMGLTPKQYDGKLQRAKQKVYSSIRVAA